jgi:hypothetical protein
MIGFKLGRFKQWQGLSFIILFAMTGEHPCRVFVDYEYESMATVLAQKGNIPVRA